MHQIHTKSDSFNIFSCIMCIFTKPSSHDVFDPVEPNETRVAVEEALVVKSEGVNRIGWVMKKQITIASAVTPWERVFCVLVKGTIYFFDKQRQDEKGYKKKGDNFKSILVRTSKLTTKQTLDIWARWILQVVLRKWLSTRSKPLVFMSSQVRRMWRVLHSMLQVLQTKSIGIIQYIKLI